MLSDAHSAWSILGSGAGFIDFTNIGGLNFIDQWSGGEYNYRYGQMIHFFDLINFTSSEWVLLGDAYGIAGQALNSSKCRSAITNGTVSKPSGLAGKGDPRNVLSDIVPKGDINGRMKHDTSMSEFAAAGTGEHPGGYIRLGNLFFSSNISKNLIWGGTAPDMSDMYARALILLHEIKHVITGDYSVSIP